MSRTQITVVLGGKSLASVDERIYVENITESVTSRHDTLARMPYGLFALNNPYRESLTLTVTFMIKEKDQQERLSVIQAVRAWAVNGYLTTNMRPSQRIYVYCTRPPDYEVFDWTARMEIQFTAVFPYWEASATKSASSTGTDLTLSITPDGTQDCYLQFQIRPNTSSTTLTSVTVTANGYTMTLGGLSVTYSGSYLTLSYDSQYIQSIKVGSTVVLNKRTASSSDDIILRAGQANSVRVQTNISCYVLLTARGLYK